MSNRYVRAYCDLMNTPIWKDDACVKLYLYCLFRATWQDYQAKSNHLHPGQLELSYRNCSVDMGWGKNSVGKRLALLAEAGLIRITGKSRSISVITLTDTRLTQQAQKEGMSNQVTCPSTGDSQAFLSPVQGQMTATVLRRGTVSSLCPPERDSQFTLSPGEGQPTYTVPQRGTAGSNCTPARDRWSISLSPTEGQHCPPERDNSVPRTGTEQYMNKAINNNTSFTEEPPDFKKLWIAYPESRRVGKSEAMEMYAQALAEGATIEAFLEALDVSKQTDDWQRENGRFIPKLVNWLEKESWRDYLYDPEKEKAEWKTE